MYENMMTNWLSMYTTMPSWTNLLPGSMYDWTKYLPTFDWTKFLPGKMHEQIKSKAHINFNSWLSIHLNIEGVIFELHNVQVVMVRFYFITPCEIWQLILTAWYSISWEYHIIN